MLLLFHRIQKETKCSHAQQSVLCRVSVKPYFDVRYL